MTQRNETAALLISFLLVVGAVGGGLWWIASRSKPDPSPSLTVQNPQSLNEVQAVPAGLFNYGGSTSWAPIRASVDPVLQTVWTNFRLRYTDPTQGAPGSAVGIRMLLDNQLSFAQSSRSVKQSEYQDAKNRGFALKEIPVAIDGIAVAVNPNLDVKTLTIAQLADIYTGKVTNWNQLGGSDLEIMPISRRLEDSGTIEFFNENVMQNKPFGSTVKFVGTTTEAIRDVATTPGGIYYASAPEVVNQCTIRAIALGRRANEAVSPYQDSQASTAACGQPRSLNATAFQTGQYPITRRLFVVVKQNGQIDEQAGEAYANLLLTNQGQDLIAKAGFVRLR